MLHLLRNTLIALCLCQSALAQPAVYRDGLLTIPEGAVFSEDANVYFKDIKFNYDGKGNFTVISAQPLNQVTVETVDIVVMESFPLQISASVSGFKSVPCVNLQSPAVSLAENTFTIILAESQLGPAESCIAVIEPFKTTIDLDVLGLEAGTYNVVVNGIAAEFTLDQDNSLQ